MTDDVATSASPTPLTRPATFPPGRLGALSLMGGATGAVPLPFVPGKILFRLRGALAHDVAQRHGLTLSPDAREILAQAESTDPRRARLRSLGTFVAGRVLARLGPVGFLSPALSALETYALGHLLDRYLERYRKPTTVRIQLDEARQIRRFIDRTLLRMLAPDLHVPKAPRADGAPSEDGREDLTRILDGVILSMAALPDYVVRRLDAAFDAVLDEAESTP